MLVRSCVAGICIALNYWGKHKRKMVIRGIKLTGKQPAATELTQRDHFTNTRLQCHYIGQLNYGNSLMVTLTVTCYAWATSSGDHLFTCGAISRPSHHFPLHYLKGLSLYHSHFNFIIFTGSTLTLCFKTIFNRGCYWEGLMAFFWGPSLGAICCRYLQHLELVRQAQEKDGNSGH